MPKSLLEKVSAFGVGRVLWQETTKYYDKMNSAVIL
jgi:hypothetical protein